MMNYDELRESLVDFFARQHHDADVARSRAESILIIVQRHAEPAFVLDCSPEACGAVFGSQSPEEAAE